MPIKTNKSAPCLFPKVRIELRRLRDQAGGSPSPVELSARSIRLERSIQEICSRYGETQANPLLISSQALERIVTLPQNTWVEIVYKPEVTDIQVGSKDSLLAEALVREFNALKIREESRPAVAELIADLLNPQIYARVKALRELSEIHAPESFEPVALALKDESPRVRRAAVPALGRLLDERAVPELLSRLKDTDHEVRELAALELSKYDTARVIRTMEDLFSLRGNSLRIKRNDAWIFASVMLKGIRDLSVTGLLVKGLEEESELIRSLAVINLGRLGHKAQILPYLHDPSPSVRESALMSLNMKDLQLFARDLLNDADIHIRNYLQYVLGEPRPENLTDPRTRLDNIQGSLLGSAIGDALGAPIEFMTAAAIQERYGRVEDLIENPRRPVKAGEFTDDTEMTLLTLNSIDPYTGRFLPLLYNKHLADHFYALDLGDRRDIGYGHNTLSIGRRLYAGVNWRLAGKNYPTCGAAMRVAPLSYFHIGTSELELLREAVVAASVITHTHPRAVAGAGALVFLLTRLLDRPAALDPAKLIGETADFVRPLSSEFADRLLTLPALLSEPPEVALQTIGTKSEAIESVIAALYCFFKSPEDFKRTVANAVNVEGDSDSIGAMAGALSGAYNGVENLPKKLLSGLKKKAEIEAALKRLLSPLNTISPEA